MPRRGEEGKWGYTSSYKLLGQTRDPLTCNLRCDPVFFLTNSIEVVQSTLAVALRFNRLR